MEEQDENLESSERKVRVQRGCYLKPCSLFSLKLLYETGSGLRFDRITSITMSMHANFALDFKRNYWSQ